MREREKARQLKKIRDLREIQQLVAETRAMEAAKALELSEKQLEDQQNLLTQTADGWRSAAERGDPCNPMLSLWGASLMAAVGQVKLGEAEVAEAERLHRGALDAWSSSLAMNRVADAGHRTARRDLAAHLGARALDDAIDLLISRGRAL